MAPDDDQARADAFVRRQLLLTWVAGLVVLVVLAGVVLTAALDGPVLLAVNVGAFAVALVLAVLLGHVARLAGFAFRKELH